MLKACWDCIAGYQQRQNDDAYSVHPNNGTQGPPLQSSGYDKMFPTPTLRAGNEIVIQGEMTTDRRLNIGIATSSSTVCQIDVSNSSNENGNFLKISSFGDVIHESEASTWFNDAGTQYLFRLAMKGNGSLMDIFVSIRENEADQYLESIAVDVNNLKMISVNGEVEKLTFIFKERRQD